MYDYHELDDRNMKGTLRDWRKALRTPATYRVGNAVRIQPQFIYLVLLIGAILVLLSYYNWFTSNQVATEHKWTYSLREYNATYPLTTPIITDNVVKFRIGIIADLDKESKGAKPHEFISYLKKGYLSYNQAEKYVTVTWDSQPAVELTSTYSHKGRGMELSELIVYDGRLLSFDDRSGMVFEILNNKVVPWVILPDGSGHVEKGFKAEWATIKDEILYVGSMGKEWTTSTGDFESYDPMWVKAINIHGAVQHLSWINQYKAVRKSIGIEWPGYMIHESAAWSSIKKLWHFLPRRCSPDKYNDTVDEVMGCNYLVTADVDFKSVQAKEITPLMRDHGFSSFKFLPGTEDEVIVALKTVEHNGKTATYITAFTTQGKVLLADTHVEDKKYEGVEFI